MGTAPAPPALELRTRASDLTIKAVEGSQRLITGYAGYFNNIDWYDDVIAPGAFAKSLQAKRLSDIAVFIGHDMSRLRVGMCVSAIEDANGLLTVTRALPTADGDALLQVATALLDGGTTLGMSIGFYITDAEQRMVGGTSVRYITGIDLMEYSYAERSIIANDLALVSEVKRRAWPVTGDLKTAIAVHHTPTDTEGAWDGPKALADAPSAAATLRYMCAWRDATGDPDAKGTYKFPHHGAGTDTAAVIAGVNNALARLSAADIPSDDDAGVLAHLHAHRTDAGLETDTGADLDLARLAVRVDALAERAIATILAYKRLGLAGYDGKAGAHMSKEELVALHGIMADLATFHDTQCTDPKCPYRGQEGSAVEEAGETPAEEAAEDTAGKIQADHRRRQLALLGAAV